MEKSFYSPETGFVSAYKMWLKNKNIPLKDWKKFIENQYSYQVTKKVIKPKKFNSIVAKEPRQSYQIDLMIYDRYEFHNYKYILMCIDVNSRYLLAKPLTNRDNETIVKNMKLIFNQMGYPKIINCDNEFNTSLINEFFEKHKIKLYFSQPDEINKNAIVERVNSTIANMLQRHRTATGKYDWYKVLPKIVDNYNNTFHTTIKATPSDVFNGEDYNKQEVVKLDVQFKVGQKVRIKLKRSIFAKGDSLSHSKTIYIIEAINGNKISLKNTETEQVLKTTYKPYEITPVQNIQYVENKEDQEEEKEHEAVQLKKKITRSMSKEGIEPSEQAIKRNLRERRPNQLVSDKYGKIIY